MIDAAVFDVGETLIDETREYGTWADWLRRRDNRGRQKATPYPLWFLVKVTGPNI